MLKREKAEVLVCVRLLQSSEPYNAIGMKTLENRFTDTRGFTPWAWTHRAGSENSFFADANYFYFYFLSYMENHYFTLSVQVDMRGIS